MNGLKRELFISTINKLVEEYKNSPEYIPPVIRNQWLSWHFVGWWALSLGLHLSLKHLNIEIHLPFGFLKISFKREATTFYDISIQL